VPRRRVLLALAFAGICGLRTHQVSAHAALRLSDPIDGATLGETPVAVRLWFSERPEPALSDIRVVDGAGAPHQIGRPEAASGDPLSLVIRVQPLDRGVYIVRWRIASAIDGHASAGAYAFGVRADPTAAAIPDAANPTSRFEIAARWIFVAGTVLLLGAAFAAVARFGGDRDPLVAAAGASTALLGVLLLAVAQRRQAGAAFADLLRTDVGRGLLWRAIAITAAGGAAAIAAFGRARDRRAAMIVALGSALAAVAIHAASGHAAASGPWYSLHVAAQWIHFSAAGVWLGGLAALLIAIRTRASLGDAAPLRRYSTIAAAALLLVAATAVLRSIDELTSWRDLAFTAYGLTIAIKIGLLGAMAALGAVNRWRSAPVAAATLAPLRRVSIAELTLAACAALAAATLGALPPPAAARRAPPGLEASGSDFATTVRVTLTTASAQPGPNRFVATVADYDSNRPVGARRVSLAFAPLDDRGLASTTLALTPRDDGSFGGSGANLAFAGRWRVTALVETATSSVDVPLEIEAKSPPQFVSIRRTPGDAPLYTVELRGLGHVRFSPDPERAGPATIHITCFTTIYEPLPVDDMVVTAGAGAGPMRPVPARRIDRHRFAADVVLAAGLNRVAAVARTANGGRLRALVELPVPRN
jgi:copper transport protein